MSLGVVAGRARGALVDACAAFRASDSQVRNRLRFAAQTLHTPFHVLWEGTSAGERTCRTPRQRRPGAAAQCCKRGVADSPISLTLHQVSLQT